MMRRLVEGMVRFVRGVRGMHPAWQVWLLALMGVNLVAPLVLWGRVEARVVAATFVASALLMAALTARFGFTRILGLGHVLWVPLLVWIGWRLEAAGGGALGLWLRSVLVLDGASLVLDAVDVVRWVRGERGDVASSSRSRGPGG